MGEHLFDNCASLSSVIISDSLKSVSKYAFFKCKNLSYINFMNGTLISYKENVSLSSFSINNNDVIEDVSPNSEFLFDSESVPSDLPIDKQIEMNTVIDTTRETVTADTFTMIDDYGFASCSNLTYFIVPNTVTSIGINAFADCSNIQFIVIPPSVLSIGDGAFVNCTSLTEITIPYNTELGNNVFIGCGNTLLIHFMNPYVVTSNYGIPIDVRVLQELLTCFLESTNILCLVNGKEIDVPIKKIRKGDYVKTSEHGYLKVDMIGTRSMVNDYTGSNYKNKLYICSPSEYPELFEPLIMTGCHSILVDTLTEKQYKGIKNNLGNIYVTDSKYRLMVCLDDRGKIYKKNGNFNIWHLALESDDYYINYGIYANGLLVETCSRRMMAEYSGMIMK